MSAAERNDAIKDHAVHLPLINIQTIARDILVQHSRLLGSGLLL